MTVVTPTQHLNESVALVAGWSEGDLERYVRNTARSLGWKRYHTRFSLGSDAGFPDELLCRPPRLIVAELKRQSGTLRPPKLRTGRWPRFTEGQGEWLRRLLACPGVETYLWRPSHWQEIATILQTGPEPGMACLRELEHALTDG